jgi:hypothetical protein
MQTLQEQLNDVDALIAAENARGSEKDQDVLAGLEQKRAVILMKIDDEKLQEEQQAAQMVRIQDATEQAAYFLDNLVIEDLTMRELCVGEEQYQMLRIAVQNKIINLAEEASKQISEVQAEENAQQNALKQQIADLKGRVNLDSEAAYEDSQLISKLQSELHQARLEVTDYQTKLKNATDEITRLESHVDDLRKEIAVGARNAYKVSDVEQSAQLKELADKIKASRIHVYDVEPDNEINPKNYTAKRVDNGEAVTYNWTQSKNYIEIKDAAEVERFRQQFANQEAVSDSPLGHEETPDVSPPTPEATFPELPSAIPPQVPAVPVAVVEGPSSDVGQSSQTVEERVAALEKRVIELEKVCNLNEEAA